MSIQNFFNSALFILLISALLTSCQKDELNDLTEEPTENIENGVAASTIFAKSETEDEEFCLEVNFPITIVYPNGTTLQTANEAELEQAMIDFYENQSTGSDDELFIEFPLSLTLEDGTIVTANSEEAIGEIIVEHCIGEWDDFEDIHDFEIEELCFDINFPIAISIDGTAQTVNSFDELTTAIIMHVEANPDADEDDFEMQFPIDVTLDDGTVVTVNSENEFGELIEVECE